jgi:hypothetical protein
MARNTGRSQDSNEERWDELPEKIRRDLSQAARRAYRQPASIRNNRAVNTAVWKGNDINDRQAQGLHGSLKQVRH